MNSAVRGAGLIGLAVILGIVLLQVIDKGPSGGGTSASNRPTQTTTGTTDTSQPGTTAGAPAKARAEVRVAVFNGSGAAGAAGNMTNKLRLLGYQVAPPADTAGRTGTVVSCKQGFDKEAAQLQGDVGQAGVEPFPGGPPPGSENVNCIVLLGR